MISSYTPIIRTSLTRRTKFELLISVLQSINEGVNKPTRLMYEVNLSWRPLQSILAELIQQGLIEEKKASQHDKRTKVNYHVTEKGLQVIRYYINAKEILEIDKKDTLERR